MSKEIVNKKENRKIAYYVCMFKKSYMWNHLRRRLKSISKHRNKVPPIIVILASSLSTIIILGDQMTIPPPSGLYISAFVSGGEGIDIVVKQRILTVYENKVLVYMDGKLNLSEQGKNKRAEGKSDPNEVVILCFCGSQEVKKPEIYSLTELIENEENKISIRGTKQGNEFKIRYRGEPGYPYVAEIPLKEISESSQSFYAQMFFKSPELTEDIYISVTPQFFEQRIDKTELSGMFRLEILADKFYFKETPSGATMGLAETASETRVFAEFDYNGNEEFWVHVGKRENRALPYLFAFAILGITGGWSWLLSILAKSHSEKCIKIKIVFNQDEIH